MAMPKSSLVFWTGICFTFSLYAGMLIGFGCLFSDERIASIALSYTYGGCVTIFLSQIVWSGCPLRLLESSLRGHEHVPKKSWLFAMIQNKYNKETARAAIVSWCITVLILNTCTIYLSYMIWRR